MKKILWVSEFNVNTGFARVSHSLIKYLTKYFDITVLDIYRTMEGSNYLHYDTTNKVKVQGKTKDSDGFAIDRLCKIAHDYDIIFIIQDVWNINRILHAMRQKGVDVPPVVCYFPVDAKSHYKEWYANFDMVSTPITYTKFACDVVQEASGIKPLIIPHGVDTDSFYEIDKPKSDIRQEFFSQANPDKPVTKFNDSFIFLSANRNQPRKRLDVIMYAFKMFLDETNAKDAVLYMHCGNTDDGHIDVSKLADKLGITRYVVLSLASQGIPPFDVPTLNKLYNMCDVGINTGLGEGFGLCQAEHAITGAPQIVPNHSACAELFSGIDNDRLLVNISADFMINPNMTIGGIVNAKDVANKMVGLYTLKRSSGLFKKLSSETKQRFLEDKYNWSNIAAQFKDAFDEAILSSSQVDGSDEASLNKATQPQ